MDLKKLFMNNKAVSPVIGVILMVAITVILAGVVGSTVFGQKTTQSAPQANLNIQAGKLPEGDTNPATIKIEHLSGDPINLDTTKIVASVNGGNSQTIVTDPKTIVSAGNVQILELKTEDTDDDADTLPDPLKDNSGDGSETIKSGDVINIKVVDVHTSQLICNRDVRF